MNNRIVKVRPGVWVTPRGTYVSVQNKPTCQHIPAESVRDDGVRLCAICHEPVKENTE